MKTSRAAPRRSPTKSARASLQIAGTSPLGAVIRMRRKELGLTQLALAGYAGCGLAFLYELEAGKPSVRLDKVLDVLRVLGLELRVEGGTGGLTIALPVSSEANRR